MNRKGFIFIETIVTVIVLSASLMVIYSSYSNAIQDEKTRLYYNDPVYLYRTFYIRDFLNAHSDIENIKNFVFEKSYITTIGTDFDAMFSDQQIDDEMRTSLKLLYDRFNINQMVIIDGASAKDCIADTDGKCKRAYETVSAKMGSFIRTLDLEDNKYYLVVEFAERESKDNGENRTIAKCVPFVEVNCPSYYVSVTI